MIIQIQRQHIAQETIDEGGVTTRDVSVVEMAPYH